MTTLTAAVGTSVIKKIQIYRNTGRKTRAAVLTETGADYIINGTLYNMTTGAVNCHLKVDGAVIAKPAYTVYGLAWDTGPDIAMTVLPCNKKNYIACTPLIVNGSKVKLVYDAGQSGSRQRTAIGLKSGQVMMHASTTGKTPETLQAQVFSEGWDSAVMLDGGASTQMTDADGRSVPGPRIVNHFILIYLEKEGLKDMTTNIYSLSKQGNKKLAKNFDVREFRCSDGTDTILIKPELVEVLQKIRDHFGKPVVINSAYRTEAKNKAVGGATYSQHKYGYAADITISGYTPKQIAAYAETLLPDSGGIGIYNSFCHIDVRETKSRWNG